MRTLKLKTVNQCSDIWYLSQRPNFSRSTWIGRKIRQESQSSNFSSPCRRQSSCRSCMNYSKKISSHTSFERWLCSVIITTISTSVRKVGRLEVRMAKIVGSSSTTSKSTQWLKAGKKFSMTASQLRRTLLCWFTKQWVVRRKEMLTKTILSLSKLFLTRATSAWALNRWASGSLRLGSRTRTCSRSLTLRSKSAYSRCMNREVLSMESQKRRSTAKMDFTNYSSWKASRRRYKFRPLIITTAPTMLSWSASRLDVWPLALKWNFLVASPKNRSMR